MEGMRSYDITELVDINEFIAYALPTMAHERGEPCGCWACTGSVRFRQRARAWFDVTQPATS